MQMSITAKRTLADGVVDAFLDDCEKVIWKKVRELDRFIDDLQAGLVRVNGTILNTDLPIVPVLVTVEGFPKAPVIDDFLYRQISEIGAIKQANVMPLSILDINDLEDVVRDSKLTITKVLSEWHSHKNFPYISLSMFLAENQDILSGKTSAWFEHRVQSIMNDFTLTLFGLEFDDVIGQINK